MFSNRVNGNSVSNWHKTRWFLFMPSLTTGLIYLTVCNTGSPSAQRKEHNMLYLTVTNLFITWQVPHCVFFKHLNSFCFCLCLLFILLIRDLSVCFQGFCDTISATVSSVDFSGTQIFWDGILLLMFPWFVFLTDSKWSVVSDIGEILRRGCKTSHKKTNKEDSHCGLFSNGLVRNCNVCNEQHAAILFKLITQVTDSHTDLWMWWGTVPWFTQSSSAAQHLKQHIQKNRWRVYLINLFHLKYLTPQLYINTQIFLPAKLTIQLDAYK